MSIVEFRKYIEENLDIIEESVNSWYRNEVNRKNIPDDNDLYNKIYDELAQFEELEEISEENFTNLVYEVMDLLEDRNFDLWQELEIDLRMDYPKEFEE